MLDRKKNEACLLTGDTLFLNEVGRPDLAVKTYLSAIDLSRMLFDSIQKIQKINDVVVVYPGHGSGSACGKSIGSGDFCTLGIQKITNYGFTIHDREVFSQKVLESMPKPPAYFGYNANINKNSPFSYEEAAKTAFTELTAEQVNDIASKENVVILDVRAIKEIK